MFFGVIQIFLVGNVCTQIATANIRVVLIDALATVTPDTGPAAS